MAIPVASTSNEFNDSDSDHSDGYLEDNYMWRMANLDLASSGSRSKFPRITVKINNKYPNHPKFIQHIENICTAPVYCQPATSSSDIFIYVNNIEDFENLKAKFVREDVPFFTYNLRSERVQKQKTNDPLVTVAVAKGFPITLESEEILEELNNAGLLAIKCILLTKKAVMKEANYPRIYLITFEKEYRWSDIEKVSCVCLTRVKWEKLNRKNGRKCLRCHNYGHIAKNCNLPPKCGKCSGKHFTRKCFSKRNNSDYTSS